jgi:hypothetical protein
MISAGVDAGLVYECSQTGDSLCALKVRTDAKKWGELLNDLLRSNTLTLPA